MDRPVRVGIVGVGGIARSTHIPQIQASALGTVTAICDVNPKALEEVGDQLSIPARLRFARWQELVACQEVDAVEVCTPNCFHVEIAEGALRAGKPVNVEKPLAMNVEETEKLRRAAEETGLCTQMCFSYRFKPAVRYAKKLIEDGVLGRLLSVNVEYLKDSGLWPGRRMEWRFRKEMAGTGVLGDLGAHLIDMTRYLVGEVSAICGRTSVIVPRRQEPDSEKWSDVETDDSCSFLVETNTGADGVYNITRGVLGRSNFIKYELYGTDGTISFDLDHPEILYLGKKVADGSLPEKLETVAVPEGYGQTQEETFLRGVLGYKDDFRPTVLDGIAVQKVLDGLYRSAEERRWITIE